LILTQKSTIEYPQRWKGKTKQEWNFEEDQDGIFVQLETRDTPSSKTLRMVHFLPLGSTQLSQDPIVLDTDNWCMFPPLFRDSETK